MATNLTFTTLISDLQNYLERGGSAVTDPTVFAQLPRIINTAERRLADAFKLLGQVEVIVATAGNGLMVRNPILNKPDRWRATASIAYGAGLTGQAWTPLFPRSYEYLKTYWPDGTATNPPEFYADIDLLHWFIAPTPDASYSVQISAWMLPALLDEANQTNFWTDWAPNALRMSALLEAAIFLKDTESVNLYGGNLQKVVAEIQPQEVQRMYDRATQRDRP